MRCSLCVSNRLTTLRADVDDKIYFHCGECDLRFLDPSARLDPAAERARYELHRGGEADEGYRRFTAPLVARLENEVRPPAAGLDFGAGREPALARELARRGYRVSLYDPFYWPDPARLTGTYEFIVACEVVEHLYDPAATFRRLFGLLAPGAPLVVMTDLWDGRGRFHDWYYRRDPTHVSFYSAETFRWIGARYGFKTVDVRGRVVCLGTRENALK